jgi:GAF domain-containing protein
VPIRTGEKVIGILALDAKEERALSENDRYLLSLLAGFVGVALTNAELAERLQAAGRPLEPALSGEAGGRVPGLAASIAEAQRLSSELRNLAAAAQALANRLQAQSTTHEVGDF